MIGRFSAPKVLVTGASSGIGAAVCERLLEEGYAVIGLSRNINASHFDHPGFTAIACDLRDSNALEFQIKSLLKSLSESKTELSAAVFCAGAGYFGHLEQLDYRKIQALIELNLLSPMLLSKLLVPYFKRRKRGHMIYLGSEAALQGSKNGTAYCASKFGLRGFVQALCAESRASGLSISMINPGMVDTAFFDELHFHPGEDPSNSIMPETIADCVKWILQADSNTVIEEINLSPRNKVIAFKT